MPAADATVVTAEDAASALASTAVPAPAQRGSQWQLRLLGALAARNGDVRITRWPSQPTALLLATLALAPGRAHPREELIERLWPGAPPDAGRNRLRQALSTLRRLLQAPGSGLADVLVADRHNVRLLGAAVQCDVLLFEHALASQRFADARNLYGGEFLPGIYDDWVIALRQRLAARFEALDSLAFSAGQTPPPLPSLAPLAPMAPPAALLSAPLLPAVGHTLLGRDAELQGLLALLLPASGARLVTLTGPGGCGKTRLAIEAARRAAAVPGCDIVVFVPLADCVDAAQAASQLRASLQLPPAPNASTPLDQAVQLLATRRALLVLDNFEQVAGGAALLATLLARTSGLTLLVTSRRAAGLDGEHEVTLAPLPTPPADAGLERTAHNPSVALFVQHARSVRPGFQVTARNCDALAALCRALEGLPLAIELAAARARAFSVAEMQQALARPDSLHNGPEDRPPGAQPFALLARSGARGRRGLRHDSMQAAIAWSWQLLEPPAQALLAALSVFRGGWTGDAAVAVTGQADARLWLEGLVADSLVRSGSSADDEPGHGAGAAEGPGGGLRFHLLEVIRQFAADQLDAARAAALRAGHRSHCLALVRALPAAGAPANAELPNLHQALRSAVADGAPAAALELALALQPHWQRRGIAPDLLALLDAAASALPDGAPLLSAACTLLAQLQLDAGAVARAHALAARALAGAGTPAERAAALCAQVRVAAEGDRRADGLPALLDQALALSAGQPGLQARATELQAALAMRFQHDPRSAEALLQRAEQLYHQAGQPRDAQLLRYERAICLRQMGRLHAALEQAEQSEVDCAHADDGVHRVRAIHLQGVLLGERRHWAEALQVYRRCVREAWAHHVQYWLAFALWNHGHNLARLRRPEQAARLMAFSERHWTTQFSPLDASDQAQVRRVRRLVRVQIGRARTQQAWVEGAGWTLAQAVAAALDADDAG